MGFGYGPRLVPHRSIGAAGCWRWKNWRGRKWRACGLSLMRIRTLPRSADSSASCARLKRDSSGLWQPRRPPRRVRRSGFAKPKNKSETRGSSTDADARNMKMANDGYRPAYNVQIKTDQKSGLIVGVEVTNKASDRGQLVPAVEEIKRRYGRKPERVLADGGFDGKADIEELHQGQIEVFCPVTGSKGRPVPAAPKPGEGAGVRAWRERMSREESYVIYRQRIRCEHPHAHMRNRGLQQFVVRGMQKAKAVMLWHVHAFNFHRTRPLRLAAA